MSSEPSAYKLVHLKSLEIYGPSIFVCSDCHILGQSTSFIRAARHLGVLMGGLLGLGTATPNSSVWHPQRLRHAGVSPCHRQPKTSEGQRSCPLSTRPIPKNTPFKCILAHCLPWFFLARDSSVDHPLKQHGFCL